MKIILFAIRIYQKFVSPNFPNACRFYPSCSQYCAEAFEKHGLIKGAIMGIWRIAKCNQFCRGGFDPVR